MCALLPACPTGTCSIAPSFCPPAHTRTPASGGTGTLTGKTARQSYPTPETDGVGALGLLLRDCRERRWLAASSRRPLVEPLAAPAQPVGRPLTTLRPLHLPALTRLKCLPLRGCRESTRDRRHASARRSADLHGWIAPACQAFSPSDTRPGYLPAQNGSRGAAYQIHAHHQSGGEMSARCRGQTTRVLA